MSLSMLTVPVSVATLGLDQDVPVPAVSDRVGDQPVEAGAEDNGGDHCGDGDDRRHQVGPHSRRRRPGGGSRAYGYRGRRRRQPDRDRRRRRGEGEDLGDARDRSRRARQATRPPTPAAPGQEEPAPEQDGQSKLTPACRIELAHRPDRGQWRQGDRTAHRQGHPSRDGDRYPRRRRPPPSRPGHPQGSSSSTRLADGRAAGAGLGPPGPTWPAPPGPRSTPRRRLGARWPVGPAVDGVELADGEVQAAAQSGGQAGRGATAGPGCRHAPGQPHPDPREGTVS